MATVDDITSGVTGLFRGLGSAARNMGLAMTVASGIAGGAMVALSQKAERVSSAFREVDTLIQGNADSQEKYGEVVSDLNTQFGLQADKLEVIEGLYQSVSAGIDQSEESQREFLSTAAELAVVGRVDLGTSVDVLSTVLNTYGMEARQANEVSETLFQTVQFGKTRVEELAPVLGRVAALGSNLGVQIDEIGAGMAVLTRTGFGARVAATGLRNIFRAMLKPSEQMQEALFDIASEQDFFAEQISGSTEKLKGLAAEYREASDAIQKFSERQSEARATQESSSTAIQEARLKIEAIEENRMDQLPQLTNAQVNEADSVEELESVINDYQFTVNKARLQEEKWRREGEEAQATLENKRTAIEETIGGAGDLEGGIGQLILQNQDFVDTLVDLNEYTEETGTAFSDLFPRTRALQGALGLVGEDGQMLTEIYSDMEEGAFDAADSWDAMDEAARNNFESFEEFKNVTEDVTAGDLDNYFEKATGPQQRLRNEISKLKESLSSLGQAFTEDVVDTIGNVVDSFGTVVDEFTSLDESIRENVSRFMILAVSIGLVLGPLLFLGGQLAIMASVFSLSLLPVLSVGIGLFALLGSSLAAAAKAGEEGEGILSQMTGVLDGLIGFLRSVGNIIQFYVIPGFIYLGNSINEVLSQISEDMGGEDAIFSLLLKVNKLSMAFRDLLMSVGDFLTKNKELISSGIQTLVAIISSDVVPNLLDFAKGIIDVISNINPAPFIAMAAGVGKLLIIGLDILGWIGRFMSNNQRLLGTIVTITGVVLSFAFALGKLAPVFSAISTAATGIGLIIGTVLTPGMTVLGSVIIPALTVALSTLGGWLATIIPFAGTLATGLGYIVTVAKLLVGGIAAVVSSIGLLPIAIGAAVVLAVALIWKFRNEIWSALTSVLSLFVGLAVGLQNWAVNLGSNFKTWGENLIDSFVNGIKNKYSDIKNAVKGVANTVKSYLGFSSPTEEGPGAEFGGPKQWGENLGGDFADGIGEMKTNVSNSSEKLADASVPETDPVDVPRGLAADPANAPTSRSQGGSGGMGMGDSITIKEKAVFFEKGAFQGVSDEELPKKVRNEVDRSMDEIIEDLEGAGRDTTPRA